MPEPGWKSLTIPEDLYNEIRRLAKLKGTTPPRFLRELLSGEGARRKKGLGNPARQSPADLGRARRKGKVAIVKEKEEHE